MPGPPPNPNESEWELDEQGNPKLDAQGNKIPKQKRLEEHLAKSPTTADKQAAALSWAQNTGGANVNVPALISNNPNTYQNQHAATQQFNALDKMGDRREKVTVQGINGPVDYVRTADGQIIPAPNSLDAIDFRLAGGNTAGSGPTTSGIHP
jgi:hypothetical protein